MVEAGFENAVRYEQVVNRMRPEIEGGCPELREYMKPQLETGRHKGFFAASVVASRLAYESVEAIP